MRPPTDHVWTVRHARPLSAACLCVLAAALAGCGGSSSTSHTASQPSNATTQTARPTPAQSNPDAGGATAATGNSSRHAITGKSRTIAAAPAAAPSQSGAASGGIGRTQAHDRTAIHTGSAHVQTARPTPATSKDDNSTAAVGPPDPCKLVSLSEAQAITGGAVTSRIEAPLGPTCIYKQSGSHAATITLAVESMNFSAATQHLEKRRPLVVRSRQAYCGQLGSQLLVVRLGGTQLLNITAPCGIAQRFAALALSHLSA